MPASIRTATRDDAAGIARVHVEGWQWAYRGQMPDEFLDGLSVEGRTQGWKRLLATGTTIFVAEVDGEIVGWAGSGEPQHPDDAEQGVAELHGIYLLQEFTGRGIGRDLMLAVEEHMRSQGAQQAILWVLDTNTATHRFYEAGDWSWDGGTRPHLVGDVELTVRRYRKSL